AVPPLRHGSLIGCELIYYAKNRSVTRGHFDFFRLPCERFDRQRNQRNANRRIGMRIPPATIPKKEKDL
ncbi:hypothetical protein, partial [uncultured Slackia sp.]|uniref:hypothetical protein n=1 Tax=uncultured Slackia sp. TaxID=665903 RepID=UPI0026070044